MSDSTLSSADIIALQQAEIARLSAELALIPKLQAKVQSLEQVRDLLFEQVRLLKAHRFGPSTEKYQVDQKDLFFDEAEALVESEAASQPTPPPSPDTPTSPPRGERRGGRQALPPELPRVDILHDLPEAQKYCPCCEGQPLVRMGEDVSEQLDIVPATVRVLRHIRFKYACKACEETVVTAALPPQPLPKSNASPDLLAWCLLAKYADALPLYRQEGIFKRYGVDLPRNTLARWVIGCSELLQPVVAALREHLLGQALIYMDETTVQVNREPGRSASANSYMWVQRGGPPGQEAVLYNYDPSRSGQVPQRLLAGYHHKLITDGYEGYAAVVRQNQLVHAGCWAHVRRKFIEAQKAAPKGKQGVAEQALAFITELYRHEKACASPDPAVRHQYRQQHSTETIKALKRWLDKKLGTVLPKSALGKALHYLSGQWKRLIVFLDHGDIPLDNNPAENAIRPFVVGRKNWLFSDTPKGADASATIYSLIETAKLNGIEPHGYIVHLLKTLPGRPPSEPVTDLLPWNVEARLTTV